MKRTVGIALLALSICVADDKKSDDKAKEKTTAEQPRENSVERVGKDTGEAVAHGSKKAASATAKGAKWLARPWSKSKDGASSEKKPKLEEKK